MMEYSFKAQTGAKRQKMDVLVVAAQVVVTVALWLRLDAILRILR